MSQPYIETEVCCCSVNSAIAAWRGGAYRVELCENLFEGGTTPSLGAIRMVRKKVDCKLYVMIRPRGYDFCYNDVEFETMADDISRLGAEGVDGVVFGILTPDGDVDYERNAVLLELAMKQGLSVTFHRAFDMTRDLPLALEMLIRLGVERILTTGGCGHALEGLAVIRELQMQAGDRLKIMAGGSSLSIAKAAIEQAEVRAVHMMLAGMVQSHMRFRNSACSMGLLPSLVCSEYSWPEIDIEAISRFVKLAHSYQPITEKAT
jgi:copper homeostasis protein